MAGTFPEAGFRLGWRASGGPCWPVLERAALKKGRVFQQIVAPSLG